MELQFQLYGKKKRKSTISIHHLKVEVDTQFKRSATLHSNVIILLPFFQ